MGRAIAIVGGAAASAVLGLAASAFAAAPTGDPQTIPTGQTITPLAAPGAIFQSLNPDLSALPDFVAGQASAVALSPDGRTLLVLTSGFNRNQGADHKNIPELSNEYVFVFGVTGERPVRRQVLKVPNSFLGLAWAPSGRRFYVSGGSDDDVAEFGLGAQGFEPGRTFRLGHKAGLGSQTLPAAAGLAVSPDGRRLLVANIENDSVSLVDLENGKVVDEQDLRPGKIDPKDTGKPGGTFPRVVAWASDRKAYVGTSRDREIIALAVDGDRIRIASRLETPGQPNAFLLAARGRRLYVAEDNTDLLAVVDTATDRLAETVPTAAPAAILGKGPRLGGAGANAIALSPDGRTLYLTNGGENAVAVMRLSARARGLTAKTGTKSSVVGLIPTGWYPTAAALSHDGRRLFVANGKSNAGPNPENCGPQLATEAKVNQAAQCGPSNAYVWQLEKAGLLSLPVPAGPALAGLTRRVALNNHMLAEPGWAHDEEVMGFLRHHIRHVIYVLKENRTYDQVLGDLEEGNGDPKLAVLGEALSPNHHQIARQFVDLDNMFASGEGSNTGWPWSLSGRTTDFTEREAPVNYADRGLGADQFGTNRWVEVSKPPAKRGAFGAPVDPDLLAGTRNVAFADGADGDEENGFIWSTALKAGLSVRNYGFLGFSPAPPQGPAREHEPFKSKLAVFDPAEKALETISDPYYRGIDIGFPDYWRFVEWKREFDGFVAKGEAPALMLVDLPTDHFGSFKDAIDGVNTVETEMASNDWALGLLVQAVAESPFARDTLIFVIEDDAQDGPDHVDAHRTVSFVVGPYVKQHAVVSERYTTVNLVRTMELVLGVAPIGLNDAFARPMTEVFDISRRPDWSYRARVSPALRATRLPLPPEDRAEAAGAACAVSQRSSEYWQAAMAGQDFTRVDHLDTPAFNRALWRGLKGDDAPYPVRRDGRDLSRERPVRAPCFAAED